MESNIKGKIAFISGASSGIGKATAEKLAEMGANLIICARRENILNELKEKLEKQYGIKVKTLVFDVRSYSDVLKNIGCIINGVDRRNFYQCHFLIKKVETTKFSC